MPTENLFAQHSIEASVLFVKQCWRWSAEVLGYLVEHTAAVIGEVDNAGIQFIEVAILHCLIYDRDDGVFVIDREGEAITKN